MTRGAIIQARAGGTRFPGKVFADINGKTMLERIIDRVSMASLGAVVVATPDLEVARLVRGKALVYVGEPEDVLLRFVNAAHTFDLSQVVRVTADCPLIDVEILDKSVEKCIHRYDYCSNVLRRTLPGGLDTEVTWRGVLDGLNVRARDQKYREHVTLFVRENTRDFSCLSVEVEGADLSTHDWRVDWPDDLDLIRDIYRACGPLANWREIVRYVSGYDAERLRIAAREWSAAGGDPSPHGPGPAGTVSDEPGPAWYERRHRSSATGGPASYRDVPATVSHETHEVDRGNL